MARTWLGIGLAACLLAGLGAPSEAQTQDIQQTVVYIQCSGPDGTSRGSGVLVSPQGHVLTAGHVVPDGPGTACAGSIGAATPNPTKQLVVQPTQIPVDAALLRFAEPGPYAFASYCGIEDWMIRRRIFVAGFPGDTETFSISYREGVLATVFPDPNGLLETDGQSVEGMSGGPVYSRNLAGIVGIVIGADFTAMGNVSYYGILPVEGIIAQTLGLQASQKACYHDTRAADLPNARWRSGDAPVDLGVSVDEGFCFLSRVEGEFNSPDDFVQITQVDGTYVLDGNSAAGGTHGGLAQCIFYE
jgi:hypothetical protein